MIEVLEMSCFIPDASIFVTLTKLTLLIVFHHYNEVLIFNPTHSIKGQLYVVKNLSKMLRSVEHLCVQFSRAYSSNVTSQCIAKNTLSMWFHESSHMNLKIWIFIRACNQSMKCHWLFYPVYVKSCWSQMLLWISKPCSWMYIWLLSYVFGCVAGWLDYNELCTIWWEGSVHGS
jgi:hypothetical protein